MKIICGIPDCPKCQRAKMANPDAKYVEFSPYAEALLNFCKAIGVASMPLIITTTEE